MAVQPPSVLNVGDDTAASAAIALLIHYFDLAPASAQLLVKKWRHQYPVNWTREAVTEALYQGRYKPISVEQILAFWQRRGRTIPHFNAEFETIIAVPLQQEFQSWEASNAISPALTPGPASANATGQTTSSITGPGAGTASAAIAPVAPLRPRLKLPGERPRAKTGFEALLGSPRSPQAQDDPTVAEPLQITQGPDPANLAQAKAQQFQPPPIGRFVPAQDASGFSSRLKAVADQINGSRPWSEAPATPVAAAAEAEGSEVVASDVTAFGLGSPDLAGSNPADLDWAGSETANLGLAGADLAGSDMAAPGHYSFGEAQLPPLPSAAVPAAIASAVEGLLMQQSALPLAPGADATAAETVAEPVAEKEPDLHHLPLAGAAVGAIAGPDASDQGPLAQGDSGQDDLGPDDFGPSDLGQEDLDRDDSTPVDVGAAEMIPGEAIAAELLEIQPSEIQPSEALIHPDFAALDVRVAPPHLESHSPMTSAEPKPEVEDMAQISELLASLVQLSSDASDDDPWLVEPGEEPGEELGAQPEAQ